jgi:hypothetical protein
MSKQTKRTRNELERLRLPDLQARFREVVGETSRSPNRKFLMRRIEEALAARAEQEQASASSEYVIEERTAEPASLQADAVETPSEATTEVVPSVSRQRGRFVSMSVEELQTKYLEVVGRATGSDDKRYLIWKIREAEKGRIPVGPRKTTERSGEPLDVKILPLRLEAAIVERMDEAWRSRGIKNRMEFFRRALGHYLTHVGADDAAAMFASAGVTGA